MSQTFYGHMAVVGIIGLLFATLTMREVNTTITEDTAKWLRPLQ